MSRVLSGIGCHLGKVVLCKNVNQGFGNSDCHTAGFKRLKKVILCRIPENGLSDHARVLKMIM